MSTERGRSDGRQQHKPGSDDITANKTGMSTTKGPLFVDLDPHIVLTFVCLSKEAFLPRSQSPLWQSTDDVGLLQIGVSESTF